ncbi:MAG: helix-turn-helix transcriptional regulator [Clostridiales bacterium]|nr:helix-turn-helix transcriptional regulator [Clostridiales bacterium]
MDKEKTGHLITELRKEKGMTQKQLADALNVTDKAVSKWERGLSFPDVSMLEPISELLDVSILEILEGERAGKDGTMSREEVQNLISESVEMSEEEMRHKREMSRFIIIFLVVLFLLLISITLNIISFLVA